MTRHAIKLALSLGARHRATETRTTSTNPGVA